MCHYFHCEYLCQDVFSDQNPKFLMGRITSRHPQCHMRSSISDVQKTYNYPSTQGNVLVVLEAERYCYWFGKLGSTTNCLKGRVL